MNPYHTLFGILILSITAFGCNSAETQTEAKEEETTSTSTHRPLTEAEKAEGWTELFNGENFDGWHGYLKDKVEGWEVKGGEMSTKGGNGDLITDKIYKNFELYWEWKISPMSNSGVFYLVNEDTAYFNPFLTAAEYQMVDDFNYPLELHPSNHSASNYGLHAPSKNTVKPVGEFNEGKLVVNEGKVEHWLNGEKVVEYELWTDEWKAKVAQTRFGEMPAYGLLKAGKIGFQDYGSGVTIRNVRIREL